ncbi:MAG: UDP-N-acetylmuramoyl-L-alanine--D-glutamate ligase [Candidatus Omnitrophica bacterium]|nr:UDP-N-acetylmuramoyl-L-alanine--D-glutamate ligase [Candidatus Omnitrophota bacterium]
MRNTAYFKNKKVTVVGLGRSGLACANLLYDLGAMVFVTDRCDNKITRENIRKLKSEKISFELGRHSENFIKGRDLVVVSPGVPDDALPVVWAKNYNIPVISEIELGGILCSGTIIAITGTNGKTTVTTLIARILETAGKKVFLLGNIGNPFCGEVARIKENDFVCLEVSSFQLSHTQSFKPKIAVILNFSCNHLDRHSSLKAYLNAKKRIFMNQDSSDYLVLNFDDKEVRRLAEEAKANIVYFSRSDNLNPNEQAALSVVSILGIDRALAISVFKEFKGLEHRLEYVMEIKGIKFINDSKCTTIDSTIWAFQNVSGKVVLIAGGKDKGNDYSLILPFIRQKVKAMVLIGESKEKIKTAFAGILPIKEANSLEDAVEQAYALASSGDSVLLSPMCASFDMFDNYEERGRVFKKAVYNLLNSSRKAQDILLRTQN